MKKSLLVLAVAVFLPLILKGKGQEEGRNILHQFLSEKAPILREYKASRQMEVRMSLGLKASMEIETTLSNERELQYHITHESGSSLIRDQLRALLEKEKEATKENQYEKAAFSSLNYVFQPQEETLGKLRFSTKPKKKEELLIDGELFLNSLAELVSAEGKLIRSPSRSLRNVHVAIHYRQIAGIRLPHSMESKAQVVLKRILPVGQATLRVQYEYQSVNGIDVIEVIETQ